MTRLQVHGYAVPSNWNVTPIEVEEELPCDQLTGAQCRFLNRGMDVAAPTAVLFRWLCQLRAAPYSYDWLDNLGRRSPRALTPGLEQLAIGQRFAVTTIASFAHNDHITGRATAQARRLFGLAAMTYRVRPTNERASRLLVRLAVEEPASRWQQGRFVALAWGDLIMMRKELLTLKSLAEEQALSRVGGGR